MSKAITLTERQQAVVDNRGGTLLVSAAAGAGKTKVLVDRIVKRICEENCNITDFLMITYTRAAAAELRAKITAALSAAIAAQPNNRHIQQQIHKVYTAQISTVHSFCSTILRENSTIAGIPSDFRVAEEQECRSLKSAAMESLLESVYTSIDSTPGIKAFIEELAYGRDDSAVPAILYDIYETVQSHPWPEKWVEECLRQMDVSAYHDASETPWGEYTLSNLKSYVKTQVPLASMALEMCDRDAAIAKAYSSNIEADIRKMNSIMFASSWDESYAAVSTAWSRLGRIGKKETYSHELQEDVKALRDRYKKAIDAKSKSVYAESDEILSDLAKTEAPIRGMFDMVKSFTELYTAKKQSHGILDYGDLEHLVIRLLVDAGTGNRTAVAEEIAKQYKEILIDEYQDSNAVQETIFTAIEGEKPNRFMVGDVKQCIYMFRLADPTIFLKHYSESKSYKDAADGEERKIVLTENFRSKPEILDATNEVMKTCMSSAVGGITYDDEEALVAGRTDFTNSNAPVVSLDIINMDSVDDSRDEDEEALAKVDVEAKHVAQRIQKMIASETIMDEATGEQRPIRASDIAVLLRSTKTPAKHYVNALNTIGIATKTTRSGSLMDTTEVSTLYCFLQILDNPNQDIPLVAVLASPLLGFTANDLATIRIAGKAANATTFYSAIREAAKTGKKAAGFCEMLSNLREGVQNPSLSDLFSYVLSITDAEEVFGSMQNGEQRMANIRAFNDIIVNYEANGAHGLFEFICYIEALREQGVEIPQPSIGAVDDAVSILSIHSSKGLEYPVVFLSDLSRRFNNSDMKGAALLHKQLGVGVQVTDKTLKYRYPTIARTAIASCMAAEAKSEELRILYVAMTRAKQCLIMTYCEKLHSILPRLATNATYPLSPAVSQAVNAPGEWVVLSALTREEGATLRAGTGVMIRDIHHSKYPWEINCIAADDIAGKRMTMSELEANADTEANDESIFTTHFTAPDKEDISKDLSFEYAHPKAIRTPSKITATAQRVATHSLSAPTIKCERPGFIKEATGLTAAEKGVATHLFMQYADYSVCRKDGKGGIESQRDQMLLEKKLSSIQGTAVQIALLNNFFQSDIGKELASMEPGKAKREFPFSIMVKASDVMGSDASDEEVLLQGIIDLFVVEDSGIKLYDFKTDYVATKEDEEAKVATYRPQLEMYASALERIFDVPVVEKSLVFLKSAHKVTF